MSREVLLISSVFIASAAMTGGDPPRAISESYILSQDMSIIEHRFDSSGYHRIQRSSLRSPFHKFSNRASYHSALRCTLSSTVITRNTWVLLLFPPDNHGQFIVVMQWKVKQGDSILVLFEMIENGKSQRNIQVFRDSVLLIDRVD